MLRRLFVLLAASAVAAACSDGGTGPETGTPVAAVSIGGEVATLTVGGTLQLTAAVTGADGSALAGHAVSWRSTNPAAADVAPTGLVTAVAPGTALVIASASGRADTASLSVLPAGTQPAALDCGGATVSLALGEARTLGGAERASFCLGGGATGAEYALIPFYGSQSSATTVALQVSGDALAPAAQASAQRAGPGSDPGLIASMARAGASDPALDVGFEDRLRGRERAQLTPLMAAARRSRARSGGPSLSVSRANVQVGAQLAFNTQGTQACTNPSMRTGRVVAVTQYAVIVADTANPANGFTDAEYREIGDAFDRIVHPLVTRNFGTPSDIDSNGGRSIIFFTRAVNELTAAGSQSVVGGFFFARDLFPKTGSGSCAGSNEGEMFYMLVPDPSGVVNGNVRTKAVVQRQTVGVLAHEYQHLINASRRLFINDAAEWEDAWLNEGLSHIAEELMFYHASGIAPRQNIDIGRLRSSQAVVDAANAYQLSNLGRLGEYLKAPETNSPYANNDELATRGAAWQLLRYAADRSNSAEQSLWFNLANSKKAGSANLAAVLGVDFMTLVREWAVAQYVDDAGFPAAASFQQPSWNFRSIYAVLAKSASFPLATRSLTGAAPVALTLNGGGAAYLRFGVASGTVATLRAGSSGSALPAAVSLTVVRTK